MKVKYEEEDKALLLLPSLPSSFKFRTTLMLGKKTLRFVEIVQDIISHIKMNKSSGDDMKSEDLLVKGSNDHRGRSKERGGKSDNCERSKSRSRKDVECYYYHKKGHIKKNCWKFKFDQKERSPRILLQLELQWRTKQNLFRFH